MGRVISESEYLRTCNDPEWEFEDGRRIRRHVGTHAHSALQGALAGYLHERRKDWGLEVLMSLTFRLRPRRYVIADVCAFRHPAPEEQIPTSPPVLWIEIVSPQDRRSAVDRRLKEILAFGAPYVWLIDPVSLESELHTPHSRKALTDGILRIPGTPIEVPLLQVFVDWQRITGRRGSSRPSSSAWPSKEAIRKREFAKIRETYREQPDTETAPDTWPNCEDFKE